jgi:L-glyceraldehyde 3-phosphate reductase
MTCSHRWTTRGSAWGRPALVWALRDPRMTSLIIGASSVQQLEQNSAALSNVDCLPLS